jgi:Rab-GTPase-TBC domain
VSLTGAFISNHNNNLLLFRAELGLCMYQLENLVQEQLPELHLHFQSQVGVKSSAKSIDCIMIFVFQGFQTSMYASSWFLTVYTTALNLNLVCCRIMDVFLSEGMEMIFKIALALLTIGKETILSLDMEQMLKVSCRCYRRVAIINRHDNDFATSSFSRKSCQGGSRATSRAFSISPTPSKLTPRR